jgi:hypothetical protein
VTALIVRSVDGYNKVLVIDAEGGTETWLVTDNELDRIRVRSSKRITATARVSGWKVAVLRWMGLL